MSNSGKQQTGLVVASFGNRGQLDPGDGSAQRYVLKGRKLRVVCGDRVNWQAQPQGNELLVTSIHTRDNALERPNSRGQTELVAANLSRLVVVLAPEPAPDFFIADRYLCAAEMMATDTLIIWNKSDLNVPIPAEIKNYQALGYGLMGISATTGSGVQEVLTTLAKDISMLVGQSGVGKSSLINNLIPDADVTTGELSTVSREGKHTTTASIMHTLPNGGRLIDSPGVREFVPFIHDPTRVQTGFKEIIERAAGCRFSNCQHIREPNCAVKAAVESSTITARRYESYKRLYSSAETFAAIDPG
ncbi:MAG: ribosome small subunit-dependent GTPase A [Gammaproteobacteria bacterium]|nr:ribosome small subunit-dependent GTPase A [Gammaproteobacteria bacterium]MCP4091166.1 ribosome small subunit-dependent GTPase A [Gammaproteobacteria bacterium]MCP4277308.1 ribosome small subunit-dependent GTPase A [Gammaproteobacteria bacterium]MCP4831631.1 ribosome small subunit-dependent GTPase A [Gammaproteobacteria bacterium]MCP4927854.1 ribosome small subunit-dependent GTPase A [Gammaproteobacteria bacterium]